MSFSYEIRNRGIKEKRQHKSFKKMIEIIKRNWVLYLFLLPCLLYVIIFNYAPMYGIIIGFKEFKPALGIWNSEWVGLTHFQRFFESYQFGALLSNTITLSFYLIVASFPFPIILALILNYTTFPALKKIAQTATYAPRLISVVVTAGMLIIFCSPNGLFNQIGALFGLKPAALLGKENLYQSIYVWSSIWQRTGYQAVIYIAALTSVSGELHEAAVVDGASKLKRIWHIDLPAIMPTIIILLIMNVGNVMSIGFEKSYLLQNDLNLGRSEIIATYVYKAGIRNAQYSYATAIGLFNNIINLTLLVTVNKVSRTLSGKSLW